MPLLLGLECAAFCWEGSKRLNRLKQLAIATLSALFAAMPIPSWAEQLRILTSMPPSFYTPFVAAFEARHPQTDVIVLNKNTNASVDELLRGNERRFDIFWASSPEPFVLLQQSDLVALQPDGTQAVHPFAYSAFGWAQRASDAVPISLDWDSLLDPALAGKIAMARPSRSGSTHMMLERFFQVRGWHEGWAYLLELSANLSTLTARSFTVLDGVASGRFEMGLTIDFLAHSHQGEPLSLTYGNPAMVTAARLAVLRGGQSRTSADLFASFVISDDGQRLLLTPEIARTPYSAKIRAASNAPYHQVLEDALALTWMEYDASLASARYWAVNALFDAFVSEPFARRQAAWARLRRLEAAHWPTDRAALLEVRRLLTEMPITEAQLGTKGTATNSGAFVALSNQQSARMDHWRTLSQSQLNAAEAMLSKIEDQGVKQ